MGKKKAAHLYDILGKSSQQAENSKEQSSGVSYSPPVAQNEGSQKVTGPNIPPQSPPEEALDTLITIRKDTAIVCVVFTIVLLILAFLIGRITAPKPKPLIEPTLKTPVTSDIPSTPPAAAEKYYLLIATYDESKRSLADEAAAFLKSKGYPVTVEKAGNKVIIKLRNFESSSDEQAKKILNGITSLEYKGRKEFKSALFIPVR
ncbi:MAG: hypothetical protein ABIH42_00540 [Planctomycetota bacterium]